MKKRRKLNLKKVMISKIDYPNNILGRGNEKELPTTPGENCKSPSDTSPNVGSVIICAQEGTGDQCH